MFRESNLDELLFERVRTAEDELLNTSDDDDPKAIKSFLDHLTEIQCMATNAITKNSLTTRTAAVIRSVASTGAALARFASGIQRAGVDVERKRQAQLEEAFGKLTLESIPEDHADSHSTRSKTNGKCKRMPGSLPASVTQQDTVDPSRNTSSSLPPHVLRCYDWLLRNLHDPYPPATFRSRVSKDTGVSQRAICDWFTNVRRKIGWTRISERHFRKERALTIDCARVILLGEKAKVPICKELRDAFLSMKDTAERLFEDVLVPSDAAKHLDDLVTQCRSKSGQDGSRELARASRQQTEETDPRSSGEKVLGKRCATSDDCVDSVALSKSSSEGHQVKRQVKRARTGPSMDSINVHDGVDCKMRPARAETQRPSLKRRHSDNDEPRSSKRCRNLSDNKDTNDLGTLAGVDSFGSVLSDNPTIASLTPSPSTSLLTMSDESIGTPSPSSLEEMTITGCSNPDSSSSSDFFNFKDLLELPDMPSFTWDGTDILPPSFEPIPLSENFSVSHPKLLDDPNHCLPGLADSDLSWLSSLEWNICSGLDSLAPNLTDQQPESNPALFPDFFQEFFRSQDNLRSDHLGGEAEEL